MSDKLPIGTSPDEVVEAIMRLLGDWFDASNAGERSVMVSVTDATSTDPEGNTVSWAAGNAGLQGLQVISLIKGLHPIAKLQMLQRLQDKETGLTAIMQSVKDSIHTSRSLDEFKTEYGGEGEPAKVKNPFDGLEDLEFLEVDDE